MRQRAKQPRLRVIAPYSFCSPQVEQMEIVTDRDRSASLWVIAGMHHVLRDGCDATQCDDGDDDLGCGLEYESKDAGQAHHKQHGPGKAAFADDGSQALPKAVHRNLHSV